MELKKCKLGDCLTMIENGAVIKQKKGADGFPITRIETLSNDKFNRDRLGYADIHDISKYSHYILDDKDLLMSHINSRAFLGRTVLYRKKTNEQIIHGMNVLRLKTDENKLNPIFAYYYFKTPSFRTAIDHIRKDAINQSSLSTQDIKNIDISIPSITEQNRIAHILYGFEQKNSLNSDINQNLEALAKQIYDYWFVQFDFPNEEGKPYKSSGGKMVWDKKLKREIPEGWDVLAFDDLFEIGNGRKIPQSDGCIPAYGGNGVVKYIGESNYESCFIIGRVGANCGSLHYSPAKCWVSDNAISATPKKKNDTAYLLNSLRLYDLSRGKGGSSQPLITHNSLKCLSFPYSSKYVSAYSNIVTKQLSLYYKNEMEISNLTKQRDELLPLLMNGQVTVK